jgi:leucyl aminopeptidase (aminopeptidase T)
MTGGNTVSWPEKEIIVPGVVNMLRENMGLKTGERLLVISDMPRSNDWVEESSAELVNMVERLMLGRLIADIASEQFVDCEVVFLPFPATGSHGAEPDEATATRMRQADVVLAVTNYSLSHTNARTEAVKSGARLASMPRFEAKMLAPGGPLAVDARQISRDCHKIADLLNEAKEVVVRSPAGTDLRFSLEGRYGQVDDGIYGEAPGMWGNLPAGEAFTTPLENTGNGTLVAPAGWYPGLKEKMVFQIENGQVVDLQGGGKVGDKFRRLLNLGSDDPLYIARRNLAELGIGCNPNARNPENVLEAEKIKGTVHIAIGDNIHMGGLVEADLHDDFVQPQADLILDGKAIIINGEWQV